MKWNWELPGWPEFEWDRDANREAEARFLIGAGRLAGAFGALALADASEFRTDLLSDEAVETSRIEGEILNRDSVQSSIRRQFGLAADARKVTPAEQGVSQVMVEAYRSCAEDLADEKLFKWHSLLMKGKHGLKDIGRYRRSPEPMQIVSGPVHDFQVHFEAPPSRRVAKEMAAFIGWFNASRTGMPALARAALAHLRFESIHPFEDGNGRLGRVIAEIALSQSAGAPLLLALSRAIHAGKKEYYSQLQKASVTLEAAGWVAYFSRTVLSAMEDSERRIAHLVFKARFFDSLRGKLNGRQEKVLLRMFVEGPDGFAGGLSAGNYVSISKASTATATRDLAELVAWGALHRSGERKHARYRLVPGGPHEDKG